MRVCKKLVSVIIPVYNTERYLEECIQSILSQTYINWELLLIDDGSNDNSGRICDIYASMDSRIKTFHQENQGVTAARKKGLDLALGDYICFVDSDDYILNTYLEVFMNHVSNKQILVAGKENMQMTSSFYLSELLKNKQEWSMMFKLYKKDCLLNSEAFEINRDVCIGEDLIANIIIAQKVDNINFIINDGYVVRENLQSVTAMREWSVNYEMKFLSCVKVALGNSFVIYYPEYWLLMLRSIKNLISNGITISRNHPLYKEVLKNKQNIPIGLIDKIVLQIPSCTLIRLFMRFANLFR